MAVVKRTEPKPVEWIPEAPQRCSASREVNAPPDRIWAVIADHERWPDWFPQVKKVTVTGAAEGVGGGRLVELSGMAVDEEFVAWDVNERFAFSAVGMTRPIFDSLTEAVTITDLGDGRSRVDYTQAFQPTWWFRLPYYAVRPQFRQALNGALENLARLAE